MSKLSDVVRAIHEKANKDFGRFPEEWTVRDSEVNELATDLQDIVLYDPDSGERGTYSQGEIAKWLRAGKSKLLGCKIRVTP